MSPILTGVIASGISGHLTPPYDGPYGAYDALATVTLSASAASITFAGIPSGYKHLQLRCITRSNETGSSTSAFTATGYIVFNSDTSANYRNHYLLGNGTAASAGDFGADNGAIIVQDLGGTFASQTANTFAAGVIDILDYTNTNKYKTVRILNGQDRNGYGRLELASGLWMSTTAISTIAITNNNTFAQYTQFALFGVK